MSRPTLNQAATALTELVDVLRGTGDHAGHSRSQIGRCVHCSCGARVQGALPAGAVSVATVFEVVLPDGFVSYRGNDRELADKRAEGHVGAFVRQANSG